MLNESEPDRNDPCPCGSGKKYKKCHGAGMSPRGKARPQSDPPVLGEPGAPILAPLKPKPSLRSGAIAAPQPESDDAFSIVKPRRSQ
jgi:hypothetical protein